MKRKRYSRQFQRMAVERMRRCDNIGDLAKELGVGRRCLYKWQAKFDHLEPGEEAPRTNSHESSYRQQVHQLKRLLAEKTINLLRKGPERDREIDTIVGNIRKAAQTGVKIVTYHCEVIPYRRNRKTPGRGGTTYDSFKLENDWKSLPMGMPVE